MHQPTKSTLLQPPLDSATPISSYGYFGDWWEFTVTLTFDPFILNTCSVSPSFDQTVYQILEKSNNPRAAAEL